MRIKYTKKEKDHSRHLTEKNENLMKTKGLTLLEITIVVAIIGLVAAIAIPAVTRLAEDVKADICRTNLNTIDKAKIQWTFDNNKSDTDEPTADELDNYIVGEVPTHCVVAGALYDIGNVITPALCSFHGNGYVSGSGTIFSPTITALIESGDLDVDDVIGKSWVWTGGPAGYKFYECKMEYYSVTRPNGTEVYQYGYGYSDIHDADTLPTITVNGNTLSGETICCYSKEEVELNRDFTNAMMEDYPEGKDYYFMSQMKEGGYEVTNGYFSGDLIDEYYDHKGNLIGSSQLNWLNWAGSKVYYYDNQHRKISERNWPIPGLDCY